MKLIQGEERRGAGTRDVRLFIKEFNNENLLLHGMVRSGRSRTLPFRCDKILIASLFSAARSGPSRPILFHLWVGIKLRGSKNHKHLNHSTRTTSELRLFFRSGFNFIGSAFRGINILSYQFSPKSLALS